MPAFGASQNNRSGSKATWRCCMLFTKGVLGRGIYNINMDYGNVNPSPSRSTVSILHFRLSVGDSEERENQLCHECVREVRQRASTTPSASRSSTRGSPTYWAFLESWNHTACRLLLPYIHTSAKGLSTQLLPGNLLRVHEVTNATKL